MTSDPVLRFDRFEIQLAQRRLLRDGEVVPLRARAFDLLVVLAERAGRLVTKDELLDLVWPGLVVEENNIAAQVASLRKVLHSQLIVTVPGRGYRFAASPQATVTATAQQAATFAAPTLAPRLFGRDDDLARLHAELRRPGCLTLVGPSGVGKTSLAHALSAGWNAGGSTASTLSVASLWLDLASLSEGAQLLPALCRALGNELPDGDAGAALARALGDAPRLLVLDNAEHLIDAVARLVPLLLAAAPALHLLITSQLPLSIGGERVDRIEPLALPRADTPDAQALQTGAVAMFVDRVLAADRRYRFLPESLPWVRRLCVDLDGLPLALEMAAARVPLLGLQRVHDALAERFSMLRHGQRDAPGRHRTLLAALDWSHDLLAPEEQRLFRALGVFAGGFTLDLAVAVAGSDAADAWDTIDRIAVLVDRSLVVGDHEDPPRYGLLETMRSYALVRLAACADENAVRARHAKALCELIGRADEAPRDPSGNELRRLGLQEMHNVREALSWAMQHDRPTAVALAVCASGLATFTTWRREVSGWLAACEPLLDASIEPRLQALWWRNFARQMMFGGNPRAVEAAWKAVALSRAVGDDSNLFWSLVPLARAWPSPNAELDAITDEMSRVLERHPEWPANARLVAIGTLAHVCFARGDFEGALKHRLAELGHARRAGIANHIGSAENNVAHALIQLGRHAEALDRLQAYLQEVGDDTSVNVVYVRALAIRAQLEMGRIEEALADAAMVIPAGRRYGVPEVADLAALLAARAGRPRSAALLLGHARETYASRGMQEPTGDCDFSKAESLLRERLDGATFERLMEQGRRLDEPAADRLLFANDDAAFHKFS